MDNQALYQKLQGMNLGSQSDDYFRNLSPMFSRGRQDAVDFLGRMRDQDPNVQLQRAADANKAATDARFAQDKTDITNFNNDFSTAVPKIISDTSQKYGLDTLLGVTQNLGSRISDLQTNSSNTGAGGFASASQVDQAVQGRYLPQYNSAVSNLEKGTTLAQNEENTLLTPYTTKAQLLNDRLSRESTGYTTEQQQELDALVAKMNAGVTLTNAEQERANQLALAEKTYNQAVQVQELKNQQLKSIGKGGGAYYDDAGVLHVVAPETSSGTSGGGWS